MQRAVLDWIGLHIKGIVGIIGDIRRGPVVYMVALDQC